MSDQTTIEVVLSSESTIGNPIVETVTVVGTVPIGPRGPAGDDGAQGIQGIQGIPGNDGADGAPGADGVGVPVGGADGQVLAKASATDFDTEWIDPAAGGGSGVVETIVPGSNVDVDATDPANPVVSMETLVDADIPASIARDSEVTSAVADEATARDAAIAVEAALARNADNLTSGTVADARIASTIARDSEVSAAVSASEAGQVRDGDAAGGVLSGTYPNPGFAADMATQAELDAAVADLIAGDGSITSIVALTQAEYDGLTPDATTYYIITDATGSGGVQSVDGLTGDVDLSGIYVAQADAYASAATTVLVSTSQTPKSTVGGWTWTSNPTNYPFGHGVFSSGAQNDEIVFDVVVTAGTYAFDLFHRKGDNAGIYTVLIDGASIGTIDGYAAADAPAKDAITGVAVTAGRRTVTLRMATKNASSSAYYATVAAFGLTRTGA